MPSEPIQLFSPSAYRGRSVNASSVRLVNMFASPSEDRGEMLAYPTPGLLLFTSFGASPVRGMHVSEAFPTRLFVVQSTTLFEVDGGGVKLNRGTLNTSSGRVSMADNGTQLMLVDGSNGFIWNMATNTFTQITDPDFPSSKHVTFLDGYFIVAKVNTGEFHLSALLNGLSWNGLDFATAESTSDALIRPHAQGGFLLLYGAVSVEVWSNTGALAFPFARISGTTQDWGLAAEHSLVKVGDNAIGLGRSSLLERTLIISGPNGIRKVVSNPDVEHEWQGYPPTPDATAIAYRREGQMFYQINFPSAAKSWLYNVTGNMWSELTYQATGRHRAEISQQFLDRMLVSDYADGNVYFLDSTVFTDNLVTISRKIVSRHVYDKGFNRMRIHRLRLDIEAGVGLATGPGTDPLVSLSISKDGGHTFGPASSRKFGLAGEFLRRPRWSRLGGGKDFVLSWEMADPVPFRVMGASALIDVGLN